MNWKALSLEKEKESKVSAAQWEKFLFNTRQAFRETELKDQELEILVKAARSPDQLQCLIQAYYQSLRSQSDPEVLRSFFDSIEKSPYPVSDWLHAFETLSQWLKDHSLHASFRDQTAYLACCSSAAGASPLTDFLNEMLSLYGFERAK